MPSNISCWYDQALGSIELKQELINITTVAVDLSSSMPMTLCQNVNLVARGKYTLSFDMYNYIECQNMTAKAFLNGVLLTELYVPTQATYKSKVYTFSADRNANTFCFNESHSPAPPFSCNSDVGGMIDNISLYLVEE